MRIAVYTTIIGDFDRPNPINEPYAKEADFYLFTNADIKLNNYNIIKISAEDDNPRRYSRKFKMCPHRYLPDYDYWIYLDGNIELLESPKRLIKKYLHGGYEIAVLKHPWRNCIYEEFDQCVNLGYVPEAQAEKQMQLIKDEGYPKDNGLTENGVMLRRNTELISNFGNHWLEFYNQHTQRDQLSFCYIAWKLKIKYNLIPNDIRNKYPMEFKWKNHACINNGWNRDAR